MNERLVMYCLSPVKKSVQIVVVSLLLAGKGWAQALSGPVTLDSVAKIAEKRAHEPFKSPKADLPAILRQDKLDYDKYREIRFRRDHALWANEHLHFGVEFFHPGYLYQEPVHINEFTPSQSQQVRFASGFFDYGKLDIGGQIPADTGYAGFRLLYPLNDPMRMDELGAFLGASYFRLLGKGLRYGISARGLAIDSGLDGRPEEFPIFTDWWLGKPQPEDSALRLFAILDSVSCVGAYEFYIQPGQTTVADVDAVLFLREPDKVHAVEPNRKPLETIGLAPLTSMFWFGKQSERKFNDYRPEVHDSDGLLMRTQSGEWVWQPLVNHTQMQHQKFTAPDIRGFGLLQRERSFDAYQDMFNLYHNVPDVWVEPRGKWGSGSVHLLELSTTYEGLDNIVAFWEPENKPRPLEPFRFAYTLYWKDHNGQRLSQNRAVSTRIGADPTDGSGRMFVIDFDGPGLDQIPQEKPPVMLTSCSTNAVLTEKQLVRNTFLGTWRVLLKMKPNAGNAAPVDLRCVLKKDDEAVSETWSYRWSAP
jgi:periplasmic glucans biosynthesis protein